MGITMHVTMGFDTDADPVDDVELLADSEGDRVADTEEQRLGVPENDGEADKDALPVDVLDGELDKLPLLDTVSDAEVDGEENGEGGAVKTDVSEFVALARVDTEADDVIEGERELVETPVVAAAELDTFGLLEDDGEANGDVLAAAVAVKGSQ